MTHQRIEQIGDCTLYLGDCLDVLPTLGKVDAVVTDPPYGTTACSWDSIIPLEEMWECLKRIVKEEGAVILTSSQPFTSFLIMSNLDNFAHEWIWNKRFAGNFVQAKRQPLKDHENILVFGMNGKQPLYFPQMTKRNKPIKKGGNNPCIAIPIQQTEKSKIFGLLKKQYDYKYPTSATSLLFSSREERGFHPTQKPVSLLQYLIATYTIKNNTVLDFTMGSGTTGVACVNLGRKFIGIEKEPKYFDIACKRIDEATRQPRLFDEPVKQPEQVALL